jgi:3-methyl-2-oxobutanoate hydroxymethyltransferase
MGEDKVTTVRLLEKKEKGEKITALTAYDFSTAKLLDEAGVDIALVGDSLGMVVLGYDSTLPVTMEDMLHHTAAVSRGVRRAMVVADMPFMSYQINADEAVANAGRFLQEAGAHAVKLEGGRPIVETVIRILDAGIPVMGHVGMTPQSVHKFGGFRLQGRTESDAERILNDAKALEQAGVFSIVLELVPKELAGQVTKAVSVPTIGIGAGPFCDGQVQVTNDLLGLYGEFHPRHAKKYADLRGVVLQAFNSYVEEVRSGKFPGAEHSF